jgi:hypothetical protein
MSSLAGPTRIVFLTILIAGCSGISAGQRRSHAADSEFGPVVTAYLGYLSNEQEVVDDRASRREITSMYYRRNSNRIGALRQMTIRLTRQTGIDYVPELEAVTSDEFGTIFENPPRPSALRQHEVIGNKFRFLGVVHGTETFYVFARLDPYEQADLMQRAGEGDANASTGAVSAPANGQKVGQSSTRARRVIPEN